MRGIGAALFGLIVAIGAAASILTFVISYISLFGASKKNFSLLLILPLFLLAYTLTLKYFVFNYCSN